MTNILKTLFLYFTGFSFLSADSEISINLSEIDVHVKRGFSAEWATLTSPIDNTWKTIPGERTGGRKLAVRDLSIPELPKHSFLSPKSSKQESFSFVFDFTFPAEITLEEDGYSLKLGSVAFGWQIYLNGALIEDQLYVGEDGRLSIFIREKSHLVHLPNKLIHRGGNRLLIHIVGPPTWPRTGFYLADSYLIAPTDDLLPAMLPRLGAPFFGSLFLVMFSIWIYFFFRLPNSRLYLYFAGWCLFQAVYLSLRTLVPFEIVGGAVMILRMEYLMVFLSVITFTATIDSVYHVALSRFARGYIYLCGLGVLAALFAAPPLMHDVLRVWQTSVIIPIVYIFYTSINLTFLQKDNVITNNASEEKQLNTLAMFTAIAVFFILVVVDIFNSIFWNFSWYITLYGSTFFTLTVSSVLLNRFVTDHKQIEEQKVSLGHEVLSKAKDLEIAHGEMNAVLTSIPDMFVRFSAEGTYLDVRGDTSLLYKQDEKLIGKNVKSRLPADIANKMIKTIQQVIATGEKISIEYFFKKGGFIQYYESAFSPFGENEVLCSVRDVSIRKSTEARLKQSEQEYKILVESMEEFVVVVDEDCNIIFANSHALILSGSDLKNVEGVSLFSLFPTQDVDKIKVAVQKAFHLRETRRIVTEGDFRSFQIWVEISFVPQIINNNVQSVLGVARDITDRVMYSRKLEDLISTLTEQNKKVEALSSEVLLASERERRKISVDLHDQIGQALTAIAINLQVIEQNTQGTKEMRTRLRACQDLVNETASKVQRFAYELHPAILDDLGLIPAIRSHSRRFSETTGIPVNVPDGVDFQLDNKDVKTIIYRVFQESLTNIAKHSNASAVEIDIAKQNGSVVMVVRDDGDGFEVDALDTFKGLGIIGMRERIKGSGGNFSVDSKPSAGTTIRLSIPSKPRQI